MSPTADTETIRRTDFVDAGYSDHQIAHAVARGDVAKVSRGVYAAPDRIAAHPDAGSELYRLRCRAAAIADDAVLSHQSAAAVLGLPVLRPDRMRVHVINGSPGNGKVRPTRHTHAGPFDDDVVLVDGVAVTSPARTAVDLACSTRFASALTACDGALALGASRDQLLECLHRRRRRGARVASRAIEYANARSANPAESWSRAQMIDGRLPAPDLQTRFTIGTGQAFVDFCWDDRLAGEFDGRIKYGRDLRRGETAADAVSREKVREDALRAQGLMVVRWTRADLERGTMLDRIRFWVQRLDLL
ncbi:type IV toxin-antitoxin system AbiEi family antitoxin domain-containing protein [Gordonia zhaorongruii]|uniref:type IV toxin-antitoxin system AbiEi family antitoxin domain-containing protein n=1 Tax=Gordonia zhaorongruii TaxID=2597659 RepID=UPI00104EC667|nr:type IV toxin-antitoxin system AbiEi family antitoxin domain-containing protein [Gordonia zhaorongruii]